MPGPCLKRALRWPAKPIAEKSSGQDGGEKTAAEKTAGEKTKVPAAALKTFTFPDGHISFAYPANWSIRTQPGPTLPGGPAEHGQVVLPNGAAIFRVYMDSPGFPSAFPSAEAARAWMDTVEYAQLKSLLMSVSYG